MFKLIDRLALIGEKRMEGYVSSLCVNFSTMEKTWMIGRCSGDSSGDVNNVNVPSWMATACELTNVPTYRIPICWLEHMFVMKLMDRLSGLDVREIVPCDTKGFEYKMTCRANLIGGILVYVKSADIFHIESNNREYIKEFENKNMFFKSRKKLGRFKGDFIIINLPLKKRSAAEHFLSKIDKAANVVAGVILKLDK